MFHKEIDPQLARLAVFCMVCFYLVTTDWNLTSVYMRIMSINIDISFDIEQRCCVLSRMIGFTAVKSITCIMDNISFYLSPVLFMTSYCS